MAVFSLSAASCRFFRLGRCLYEEALNPGYRQERRCVRLERLVREWDDFLDRAEAFHLSAPLAARIWDNRRHSAIMSRTLCPDMKPLQEGEDTGNEDETLDCIHLYQGACVLAMPPCLARCALYVAL